MAVGGQDLSVPACLPKFNPKGSEGQAVLGGCLGPWEACSEVEVWQSAQPNTGLLGLVPLVLKGKVAHRHTDNHTLKATLALVK